MSRFSCCKSWKAMGKTHGVKCNMLGTQGNPGKGGISTLGSSGFVKTHHHLVRVPGHVLCKSKMVCCTRKPLCWLKRSRVVWTHGEKRASFVHSSTIQLAFNKWPARRVPVKLVDLESNSCFWSPRDENGWHAMPPPKNCAFGAAEWMALMTLESLMSPWTTTGWPSACCRNHEQYFSFWSFKHVTFTPQAFNPVLPPPMPEQTSTAVSCCRRSGARKSSSCVCSVDSIQKCPLWKATAPSRMLKSPGKS